LIVRISVLLFSAALSLAAPMLLRAQDPGAAQDAEAAREKLLKASDELDNIQANSESTRTAVDGVKTDVASLQQNVTTLQNENAALKQQLADLQAAFDQYKADQAKERQALIDNVASMIASSGGKSSKKKKTTAEASEKTASSSSSAPSTEVHSTTPDNAPSLAPPPDNSTTNATNDTPPPAPKKEKGYYHTVVQGETVPIIAAAYRDAGVKVSSAQIRKANGLTPDSVLTPGQKLFIPKPGT
jgi:LysM repeat protein